jgi:flagella basal body P-ring formation protein FlgA
VFPKSVLVIVLASRILWSGEPEERVFNAIQNYFVQSLDVESGMIDLTVGRVSDTFLRRLLGFELSVNSQRDAIRLGKQTVWVEAVKGNVVKDKIPVSVNVTLIVPVCIAVEKINRHQIITNDLIGMELRRVSRYADYFFYSGAEIIGKQTNRMIRKDAMIRAKYLRTPPEISAGDQINIKIKSNNLVITTKGIAKQEGGKGETISVLCESTGKRINGVVVSHSLVVVDQEME